MISDGVTPVMGGYWWMEGGDRVDDGGGMMERKIRITMVGVGWG